MFNVINHQGNANHNYIKISFHTHQDGCNEKQGKCWQGCGETGTLIYCHLEYKTVHFEKLSVLQMVKHRVAIWFSNSISRYIYQSKENMYAHVKMCTWIFTAALFIISKRWNQPKYSSIDERINKIWYIHRVDYFIIKTVVPIQASTWIKPEKVIVSKRYQTQKSCVLLKLIWNIQKRQIHWDTK